MNRRYLVVGNWKMNTNLASAVRLADGLRAAISPDLATIDTAVCPPLVYLQRVAEALRQSNIAVGGQDVSRFPGQGSFTGEVSAAMLADVGCRYVIVGHSERRTKLGESSEQVAVKVKAAQEAQLTPIVCIGETLEEREAGRTESVLKQQLKSVIDDLGISAFRHLVLAYEPVWAIGTGHTASPEQAEDVHAFLRAHIAAHDDIIARRLVILYGGGLKPESAESLFSRDSVDGGLVGGASLSADDFSAIVRCAARLAA